MKSLTDQRGDFFLEFKKYYECYWLRRGGARNAPQKPIRDFIPYLLVKYSNYGAILHQIPDNSKVLDLGCGDGNVSQLYVKRKSCKVIGIDISGSAVKLAREKIEALCGDLNDTSFPFKDEVFDAVTVVDVLEHLINPLSLLSETHRLLRPGGRLILSVPNFARWDNRIRMLFGKPLDILHWEKYGDGVEHLHWFTREKIIHFLGKAGFKKVKFVPTGLPCGFLFGLLSMYGLSRVLTVVARKEHPILVSPKIENAAQRVKEHFYPNLYSRRFQATADEIIRRLKGPLVLDVGCGSGWLLREIYREGFNVMGLDYSEKSIAESKFIFESEGLDIPLVRGKAEELPFKDGTFDSTTMIGVLEHVPNPRQAMEEINRVLRENGMLCVSVPNTYTYGVVYDRIISPIFNTTPWGYDNVLNRLFSEIGLRRIHELSDDHVIQFSTNSFKKLLEDTGFEITEFSNMEIFSSYFASLFCGLLRMPRTVINPIENLDIKLSKHLPLICGAGWLGVCRKL